MRKLESLREHMTNALAHRGLRDNPSDLHFSIPAGTAVAHSRGGPDRAFEYQYTVAMGVFDCAYSLDEILIPLMMWVERWQPDLLHLTAGGIAWEVEQLDDTKYDAIIRIPISETVTLITRPDGGHDVSRPPEPVPFALEPTAQLHRVYLDGALIASCEHDVASDA